MQRVWRCYDLLLETVVAGTVIAVVGVMAAQVVARYVLGSPLVWAEETATYLFVWSVFLGGGLASQRRAHIALDSLVRRLPPVVTSRIELAISILMLSFLALLAVEGLRFVQANRGVSAYTTTWFTLSQAYAAVVVGALVMAIGLVRARGASR